MLTLSTTLGRIKTRRAHSALQATKDPSVNPATARQTELCDELPSQ